MKTRRTRTVEFTGICERCDWRSDGITRPYIDRQAREHTLATAHTTWVRKVEHVRLDPDWKEET